MHVEEIRVTETELEKEMEGEGHGQQEPGPWTERKQNWPALLVPETATENVQCILHGPWRREKRFHDFLSCESQPLPRAAQEMQALVGRGRWTPRLHRYSLCWVGRGGQAGASGCHSSGPSRVIRGGWSKSLLWSVYLLPFQPASATWYPLTRV